MAAKKSDAKPRAKPRPKPKPNFVTFVSPHQSLRVNGYTTEDVNEVRVLAGISFDQPALLKKGP